MAAAAVLRSDALEQARLPLLLRRSVWLPETAQTDAFDLLVERRDGPANPKHVGRIEA